MLVRLGICDSPSEKLPRLLDIVQYLCLVVDRRFRAVEAEESDPLFAWLGVDPVGFPSGGRLRPEEDVHGRIAVFFGS